ncbi:2'-5' RNA ligase family protein [Sphingomonas alpina]|uniref:2'-5' RNA ligase n=1 Tax=Sphingomonas alpina TaxID=653931 RepID=A0A7H0LHL8_9SPHN|nr:2'-5' RNA ligase family protein [Sphingomonas alpina]QNQ09171.1 2'-5' RNA ligase [Sphingomonas alpina]
MFHQSLVYHRPFYALRPSIAAAQEIDRRSAIEARGARRILIDHLHLTLAMTDDHSAFPRDIIDRMMMIGAAVAAEPVEILLEVMAGSNRSVALRPRRASSVLKGLQRRITDAMRAQGVPERDGGYRFSPHVTLFYRDGRPFNERIDPIGWVAGELVLIHSLVGRTRHEVLGRWPLGRDGGDGQLSLF